MAYCTLTWSQQQLAVYTTLAVETWQRWQQRTAHYLHDGESPGNEHYDTSRDRNRGSHIAARSENWPHNEKCRKNEQSVEQTDSNSLHFITNDCFLDRIQNVCVDRVGTHTFLRLFTVMYKFTEHNAQWRASTTYR